MKPRQVLNSRGACLKVWQTLMNVRVRHLACCRTGSMHINGRVDRLIFP